MHLELNEKRQQNKKRRINSPFFPRFYQEKWVFRNAFFNFLPAI